LDDHQAVPDLGPGRRVLQPDRGPRSRIPAGARSRFQPIGIEDVARCITACFADDRAHGQVLELGGPRYWIYPEMVREVLRAMGARRAMLPMPVPLIRLVAGGAELVRLPFPVATDQLAQMDLDNITRLDAVPSLFGFEPADMSGRLGYLKLRRDDQELLVGQGRAWDRERASDGEPATDPGRP
jgi:uncharacterized protein YbjT (DUF2867 family)